MSLFHCPLTRAFVAWQLRLLRWQQWNGCVMKASCMPSQQEVHQQQQQVGRTTIVMQAGRYTLMQHYGSSGSSRLRQQIEGAVSQ